MIYRVESYHDPYSGHGPYYRVVGSSGTAGELVEGVPYPMDGIHSKVTAQRKAEQLNAEATRIP